jgi:hypothetical protein
VEESAKFILLPTDGDHSERPFADLEAVPEGAWPVHVRPRVGRAIPTLPLDLGQVPVTTGPGILDDGGAFLFLAQVVYNSACSKLGVLFFWQMPLSLHHVGMSYDSLTMGLPSVPEYFRGRNVAMYRVVRRGRTLHLQAGCLPFILRHLAKGISLLFVNFVPPDHRRSVSTVSVHHGPRGYWKDGSRNCRGAFSCGAPTVLRRGVLCTREGLCAS